MFRTVPARWFEELIAKPMLARAVEVLAETGEVEFEFEKTDDPALEFPGLRDQLVPYHDIVRRYRDFLPRPVAPHAVATERLETAIERNLERLERWRASVAPLVEDIETLGREHWQLTELIAFLSLVDEVRLDLTALHEAARMLEARLFVLPAGTATPGVAERILHLRVEDENATFLLALGAAEACEAAERVMSGLDGRTIPIPDWVTGTIGEVMTQASQRASNLDHELGDLKDRLHSISEKGGIPGVLGELRRLDWLLERLEGVPVGDYFAHLTGWTSDEDGVRLRVALEHAGLPAVLSLRNVPPGERTPPTLLRNPAWIRPFEFFEGLMGTPAHTEAESSPLIAVIAPLLFGYMFGDVGHGIVILTIGLMLRRLWPPAAMLISGGVSSILFGLLYGSIFTFEDVIPSLWLNPLEVPLVVLFVPLLFGGALIVTGMVLNGFGHFWERRFGFWLRSEAGIMVAYLSLAGTVVAGDQYAAGIPAGITWHVLGSLYSYRDEGAAAVGSAIRDLFEYAMQLVVNTVSFVRVGAFALAHAGLGAAVFSLSASSDSLIVTVLVLLLGNALIIALEGLVVSVQTTRLLLFEFFIRFMKAGGRPFRPMTPPDYEQLISSGSSGKEEQWQHPNEA